MFTLLEHRDAHTEDVPTDKGTNMATATPCIITCPAQLAAHSHTAATPYPTLVVSLFT